MTVVVKKGGRRQAFSPSKIRSSIRMAAKRARFSPEKIRKLVKEVGEPVIDFYKKKKLARTTDIRKSILGRLNRNAKSVASVWKKYKKKKSK
jgi:transcriptional regulator NrdR family protein